MKHEILEEVWRVRDKISADCGYDLKRLVLRLRRLEATHADRLVSYADHGPKKVTGKRAAKAGKPIRPKRPPAHV